MNIITLGYSNIGKTYFMGSLFKLSFELCRKGFSLQHRNFKELGNIEDVFTVISGNKPGMIPTSKKLKTSDMLLSKGFTTVVEDVKLIDIEGQAIVAGQNTDMANKIEESINGCDGLFLVLQSPKNIQETEESQRQLAQMINFSKEVLNQNREIPVALILNKLDDLPEAKVIGENVSKEEEKMEKELRQSKNLPEYEIDKIMESKRGQILGRLVRPAVETKWNYRLIRQFFTWIRASGGQIPNRVFPAPRLVLETRQKIFTEAVRLLQIRYGH